MIIGPNQNIIDNVMRLSNRLKFNIILDIKNSIFRSLIQDMDFVNFIVSNDESSTNRICSLFNINGYIASDYISHSQKQSIFQGCHIKDMILILEPPMTLLKREDVILLADRLSDTKKIGIDSAIVDKWPSSIIDISTVSIGIKDRELNKDKRKPLVILSDGSQFAQKISMILHRKYADLKILQSFDDYDKSIDILNEYKVCLNIGLIIDSLFAMSAGCKVISSQSIRPDIETYKDIEHLLSLLDYHIENYDFKKQKTVAKKLIKESDYETFSKSFKNTISTYFMEPFIL